MALIRCSHCQHVKVDSEFAKDVSRPNKRNAWCKLCCKRKREENPERVKQSQKRWKKANPEYHAAYVLKKYGLTLEDKQRMFGEQEGKCAICSTPMEFSAAHVDHCHEQGHVRALLCVRCNIGLGMFNDAPEVLERALRYVESHRR